MVKKTINLKYGDWGGYNNPKDNERKVELPTAFWFMRNYSENLIEIGEVTPHYREPQHTVYDLQKEKETTIIMDAMDVDYKGKNVVSISTIEHVGRGDYDFAKDEYKAWNLLQKIKKESSNYFISFPVGYNKDFEKVLTDNKIQYILMERNQPNDWCMSKGVLSDFEYGTPYEAGNAVAFLTNLNIEFTFGD